MPRCVAIPNTRCSRKAGKRGGDLYVCSQHASLITMALIDDCYSPQTRRMLAFTRWENAREGQALVDRSRREAAKAL